MNMLEARDEFRRLWPQLRQFYPWDKMYHVITPDHVRQFAKAVRQAEITIAIPPEWVEDLRLDYDKVTFTFGDLMNVGDLHDCDDEAGGGDWLTKQLWRILVEKSNRLNETGDDYVLPPEKRLPRLPASVGQARGYMFRTMGGLHALNASITTGGIHFTDHDDRGRVWPANSEQDLLYYASL